MRPNTLQSARQASVPIVTGSNRTSSQGVPIISPLSRTSVLIPIIIPANETLSLPIAGNRFYLVFAQSQIDIRPRNGVQTGVFCTYSQGLGKNVPMENAFDNLDFQNNTANPILIYLSAGFDDLIDNRLVLTDAVTFQMIGSSVYTGTPAAATVAIPDRSNTVVQDVNGDSFYAVNRVATLFFNGHASDDVTVQNSGGSSNLAVNFARTGLRLDIRGDIRAVGVGAGNITGTIMEIYNAIAAP